MADSTPASSASSSPVSLVKSLIDAGIHFGHRANSWNPKMTPYIFGKRNRIHIIDVKETIKGLLLARKFITKEVAAGKDVLFVGTKRQARSIVEAHVKECGMHYVTERWLGGTLTNFATIRQRLKRLEELEGLEESGEIANYSKKMEATLNRERSKIKRNLEGIRNMGKLPGLMVIIDVNAEQNAVKEARKLGIPIVALLDTDSNPDDADIAIPGNDDAMRAIEIVVDQLAKAANEGRSKRPQAAPSAEGMVDPETGGPVQGDPRGPKGPGGRRSNRSQFSAAAEAPAEAPGQTAEQAQQGAASEPISDEKVDGATADKPAHQPAATV